MILLEILDNPIMDAGEKWQEIFTLTGKTYPVVFDLCARGIPAFLISIGLSEWHPAFLTSSETRNARAALWPLSDSPGNPSIEPTLPNSLG